MSTNELNGIGRDGDPKMRDEGQTQNKQHEEFQYLNLIRQVLDEGEHRPDR